MGFQSVLWLNWIPVIEQFDINHTWDIVLSRTWKYLKGEFVLVHMLITQMAVIPKPKVQTTNQTDQILAQELLSERSTGRFGRGRNSHWLTLKVLRLAQIYSGFGWDTLLIGKWVVKTLKNITKSVNMMKPNLRACLESTAERKKLVRTQKLITEISVFSTLLVILRQWMPESTYQLDSAHGTWQTP